MRGMPSIQTVGIFTSLSVNPESSYLKPQKSCLVQDCFHLVHPDDLPKPVANYVGSRYKFFELDFTSLSVSAPSCPYNKLSPLKKWQQPNPHSSASVAPGSMWPSPLWPVLTCCMYYGQGSVASSYISNSIRVTVYLVTIRV